MTGFLSVSHHCLHDDHPESFIAPSQHYANVLLRITRWNGSGFG
jgi:hypothetical protein